mgnify:CR=1 FL=1
MANTENCPKVGIVMGSDSDMPVMAKAADILEELGIPYEMTVISAHREPDVFFEYAKSAEEKGFKVIIAGAGMAAHLPGMCAAIFPMPVIGIPMHTTSLGGRDSLYSIVQMPSGIKGNFLCSRKNGDKFKECRTSGSQDPGYFRRRTSRKVKSIQHQIKRTGRSQRCKTAGDRL